MKQTNPEWSEKELATLHYLKVVKSMSLKGIAEFLNRSFDGTSNKWKRFEWKNFNSVLSEKEMQMIDKQIFPDDYIEGKLQETKSSILEAYDKKHYTKILKEKAAKDIVAEKLKQAIKAMPPLVAKDFRSPKIKHSGSDEEACLVLSDLHCGLVVNASETFELGSYSMKTFEQHCVNLTNSVLKITDLHRHAYPIKTLNIFCLGDLIQGMNGAGQWSPVYIETDTVTQIFTCIAQLQKMFAIFSQNFEKVNVYTVFGNHGRCLPMSTRVLTPYGYKSYGEVEVGDLVGTINEKNNGFEFQQIQRKHFYQEENMFVMNNQKFFFECTLDHDVLRVRGEKGRERLEKIKASEILKRKAEIRIPITAKSKITSKFDITDEELAIIGLILSDGLYSKDSDEITFNVSEKADVKLIKSYLEKINQPYEKIITNIMNCSMHSFKLSSSDYLKKVRTIVPDRENIGLWVFRLSKDQVKVLFNSIVMECGTKKILRIFNRFWRTSTSNSIWKNKTALESLVALFTTNEISCALRKHERKPNDTEDVYFINIKDTDNYLIWAKYGKVVNKPQDVWCLTVPNGTLAVMDKDGSAYFTGNCAKRGEEKEHVNWDHISYLFLENALSNLKNIQFFNNRSWLNMATVKNHKFLLTHGEDIKSWGGIPFVGAQRAEARYRTLLEHTKSPQEAFRVTQPYFERAVKNPNDENASIELIKALMLYAKSFDILVMGHFHLPGSFSTNSGGKIIMNGSFYGGDNFSLKCLQSASTPTQKFFGVHPKGLTWQYDVDLTRE